MKVHNVIDNMRDRVMLAMAHRYLYYARRQPVLSDYDYDRLEEEAVTIAFKEHPIHSPGSSNADDYLYEEQCMGQYILNESRKKCQI